MRSISIITPSFNQGRFYETLMQSVKEIASRSLQLNRPIKVNHLIIDGGSSDDTFERWIASASEYQENYFTSFISNRDSGHQEAITKGILLASGDYIAACNTSDFYFDDWIGKAISIFSHEDVDCVWSSTGIMKEGENRIIEIGGGRVTHPAIVGKKYSLEQYLKFRVGFIECTAVFKREVLQSLMPLNQNLIHPWLDIQIRFYLAGFTSFFKREIGAATRIHSDSISNSDRDAQGKSFMELGERIDRIIHERL